MIYGYARVSTTGQARNGNSLEEQRVLLEQAGATVIYSDAFTGTTKDRPEFIKLLSTLQSGDTLVVSKLDRFARSAQQGMETIDKLWKRGVTVNILNIGVLNNTSTGRLIRNIFLSFAEFEHDMIIERTSEGKEIARQNPNYREGRPRVNSSKFPEYLKKTQNGELSVKQAISELGISETTWYNLKRSVNYGNA